MNQKIIQVAGFSNSGKTTLVEKLVNLFVNENYRVGTIKHHGHGGDLTSLDTGKDSWKHRQAGSIVSGAVSQGTLQLNVMKKEPWEAVELISMYEQFPLDVIIIEGFKKSPFTKVVIVKEEEDLVLLTKLENIFCVISWFPLTNVVRKEGITYFQLEDETNYMGFILQTLKGQKNE